MGATPRERAADLHAALTDLVTTFLAADASEEAARFAADQRAAVVRAPGAYAPDMPAVLDMDLAHTAVRVDGPARRITVTY